MVDLTPKQLVDHLANAIGSAWAECLELPQPVSIVVPGQPIQSSLLVFKVIILDGTSWDAMTDSFYDVKTSTNVVFDFEKDSDNNLWIRAGVDVFAGVRLDRGILSRAHSVINDLGFASPRRLQLIKLTRDELPQQTHLSAEVLKERQTTAYFLRYSLRLNPQDIAFALSFLERIHPGHRWSTLYNISGNTGEFIHLWYKNTSLTVCSSKEFGPGAPCGWNPRKRLP
jgi:hypothetical protein